MAYLRTKIVAYNWQAFTNQQVLIGNFVSNIHVRIDQSAQGHYTANEVDGLLDANAQAVGVMNRDYPGGAWANAMNQLQYRIEFQQGLFMLFRWDAQNGCPYLFHIDAPQKHYQRENRQAAADRFQQLYGKGQVK